MRNRIFGRREEFGDKINPELDAQILRYLDEAELLFAESYELGTELIDKAEKLCFLRGHNPQTVLRMKEIHDLYSMDLRNYNA